MTTSRCSVPLPLWVSKTAAKMEASRVTDDASWSRYWVDTYFSLGGRSDSTGRKCCPKKAAYALWYLGWLKASPRPSLNWPLGQIRDELGKKAAYAAIAVRLLSRGSAAKPRSELWQSVRREFQRETGESAAKSEQGAVTIAVGLLQHGNLRGP